VQRTATFEKRGQGNGVGLHTGRPHASKCREQFLVLVAMGQAWCDSFLQWLLGDVIEPPVTAVASVATVLVILYPHPLLS
jgi:hypothetical protein